MKIYRKIMKNQQFFFEKLSNPGFRGWIGSRYIFREKSKQTIKFYGKSHELKSSFFIRSRCIFVEKTILFFRFWNV